MAAWIETCRSVVSPWECDVTEHFTIAYYFDRLSDAAVTTAQDQGLRDLVDSAQRRFDVRFVRELRAGASFHVLSAPIAVDENSVRFGHQLIDSADGEVTAWVEETLDHPVGLLPRNLREAIGGRLLVWPGPAVERRPEPTTLEQFIPTVRDRIKPMDLEFEWDAGAFGVRPPLHGGIHPGTRRHWRDLFLYEDRAPRLFHIRARAAGNRLAAIGRSGPRRNGHRTSRQFVDSLRSSDVRSRDRS